MPTMNFGSCTEAQIEQYFACMETACEPTLRICYGPGFRRGEYGGVCGDYLECVVECGCENTSCIARCDGAQACGQCFVDNPCGTHCAPNCAARPGDRTCDDLDTCCTTLPDRARTNCRSVVTMGRNLGAQGDSFCSTLLQVYEASDCR